MSAQRLPALIAFIVLVILLVLVLVGVLEAFKATFFAITDIGLLITIERLIT